MTDKYEKFKDWFMNLESIPTKIIGLNPVDTKHFPICYGRQVVDRKKVFKLFEQEQIEEEKENEVKKILDKYIPFVGITGVDMEEEIRLNGTVDECYQELKEKGLIKYDENGE